MLGVIHGRLTRDVELKEYKTKKGDSGQVARFSIAADNHYGAGTETSFYDCVLFGKKAEAINKFCSKGSEIVVTGYLEQEEYEDKEGKKKRTWKLSVNDFEFCGKKQDAGESAPQAQKFEELSEDVPF